MGHNKVEEVESFTYLGANVTKDGGGTADIKRRVAPASASFKSAFQHLAGHKHQQKDQSLPFQEPSLDSPAIWMRDLEADHGRREETRHPPD
ncbi:hypothetical protein BaRGS_00024511 [Batillaria attramentaria]|uniref:Uncharacterized protein n=1 Tax=Batillaria attramentaria TaxID=370345 RepID=A0ABD0KB51_9CAEN